MKALNEFRSGVPSNELRIGNLVNNYSYGIAQVGGLTHDTNFGADPIPLTEEQKESGINQLAKFHSGEIVETIGDFIRSKVESVHHLQNLLFALTGEEWEPNSN